MRSYPPSVSSLLQESSGIVVIVKISLAQCAPFKLQAVAFALDKAFAAMSPFSTQEHIL
jgi:hypothetical protein